MSDYGQVLVLYQISNELTRSAGGRTDYSSYNAFYMPRKGGVTLSTVKRCCLALRNLSALGPDGYHWRVRIDEKPNTSHSSNAPPSSSSSAITFSWWDVQDENARLPVKEATPSELRRMFAPPKQKHASDEGDVTQEVTKAAKGAMKYVEKAMTAVASSAVGGGGLGDDDLNAVRTPVICFKLLDLGKVRREFVGRDVGAAMTARDPNRRRVASGGA